MIQIISNGIPFCFLQVNVWWLRPVSESTQTHFDRRRLGANLILSIRLPMVCFSWYTKIIKCPVLVESFCHGNRPYLRSNARKSSSNNDSRARACAAHWYPFNGTKNCLPRILRKATVSQQKKRSKALKRSVSNQQARDRTGIQVTFPSLSQLKPGFLTFVLSVCFRRSLEKSRLDRLLWRNETF